MKKIRELISNFRNQHKLIWILKFFLARNESEQEAESPNKPPMMTAILAGKFKKIYFIIKYFIDL